MHFVDIVLILFCFVYYGSALYLGDAVISAEINQLPVLGIILTRIRVLFHEMAALSISRKFCSQSVLLSVALFFSSFM